MEKFSVKKPFTILVGVIVVILLGIVALPRMRSDLLPEMSLPYLLVITPYPGASPEKVEAEVTEPLESALGTVTGVRTILSVNSENYSMVQLEFEGGTEMNSTLVKVSSALDQIASSLPEGVTTPTLMEISMDMMATLYVAVNHGDSDVFELSDYVEERVVPRVERTAGVARVSTVGLAERSIQVDLDQSKIDSLNDRLLAETNKALAEAKEMLDEAQKKVDDAQAELEAQEAAFGETVSGEIFDQVGDSLEEAAQELRNQVVDLHNDLVDVEYAAIQLEEAARDADIQAPSASELDALQAVIARLRQDAENIDASSLPALLRSSSQIAQTAGQAQAILDSLRAQDVTGSLSYPISAALGQLRLVIAGIDSLPGLLSQAEEAYAGLTQAQLDAAVGFATATQQLSSAQAQLSAAREQYENYRESALENINVDAMLSADMLSQLIYAQNFSMPAGYIDDRNDNSWLLKVGDRYEEEGELTNTLLVEMAEPIGSVRLSDIATVTVIDNTEETYANLNGSNGIILCIYKNSTAGTNDVSTACMQTFDELQKADEALTVVTLMDQGSYITMVVQSILSSMLLGAALAVVILALFLRSVRPTILVAISMPLSVLATLVLMYFSKLTLNMMTLSGIALGIGMLVDNSIVVMENIFRLRQLGIPAARAAVQGAKQVRGAIMASTLTTVCVFLPMVFTSGTVRELLVPMALSIGYCLTASLVTALTVIPAASSTILARYVPKQQTLFRRVQNFYGRVLSWCLAHKPVPLCIAVALLVFTTWQAFRTGVVLIPELVADNIQVNIHTSTEISQAESYRQADEVMETLLAVDGVQDVGIMDAGSSAAIFGPFGGSVLGDSNFICYVTAPEATDPKVFHRISDDIEAATAELPAGVTVTGSGMSDMEAFLGSTDMQINIYGDDTDELQRIGAEVKELVESVKGFTNVSDGSEDGDLTLHLKIDKDKAASYGLTIAQIYMQIRERIQTSVNSTSITTDGADLDVIIRDVTDPLTKENLMDMEFESVSFANAAMEEAGLADGASLAETLDALGAEDNEDGEEGGAAEAEEEAESNRHRLREFATVEETLSMDSILREDQTRYLTVTASTEDGYNTQLLRRELAPLLEKYEKEIPSDYRIAFAGSTVQLDDMIEQMIMLLALALVLIYLVMVAQFQSLLSPFIVFFTVPLAFTGGMIGLVVAREQISLISLMGFLILMGTVVNNGIVFVDYANQLRRGGMERRDALVATGKTRMRPILMTALTTILAMAQLIFGSGMGSQLGRGMAIVIAGGLLYATLMTLFIIPVMYDIFFRRRPLIVDIGDEIDDAIDDAAQFLAELNS